MSAKKVGRKGKLDQDLPFRYRQTFAIFPNRSRGWAKYARFAVFWQGVLAIQTRDPKRDDDTTKWANGSHLARDWSGTQSTQPSVDHRLVRGGARICSSSRLLGSH